MALTVSLRSLQIHSQTPSASTAGCSLPGNSPRTVGKIHSVEPSKEPSGFRLGADHSEKGICGSVLKDRALLPPDDGFRADTEEPLQRILREPPRLPDPSNLIRGQETLFAAYGFRGPPQGRVHLARCIIRLLTGFKC